MSVHWGGRSLHYLCCLHPIPNTKYLSNFNMSASIARATVRAVSRRKILATRAALTLVSAQCMYNRIKKPNKHLVLKYSRSHTWQKPLTLVVARLSHLINNSVIIDSLVHSDTSRWRFKYNSRLDLTFIVVVLFKLTLRSVFMGRLAVSRYLGSRIKCVCTTASEPYNVRLNVNVPYKYNFGRI